MNRKSTIAVLFITCCLTVAVIAFTFSGAKPANAQFVPDFGEHHMDQIFTVMKGNVRQIYEPVSEQDRWDANVAMWQAILTHLNDQPNIDMKLMDQTLRQIQSNVFHIMQPAERERWDANVRMWQLMVAHLNDPANFSPLEFRSVLGVMNTNIHEIEEPGERERWQANYDLWQMLVARVSNQMIPIGAN